MVTLFYHLSKVFSSINIKYSICYVRNIRCCELFYTEAVFCFVKSIKLVYKNILGSGCVGWG